jgi:PAS domain S-box-containing protein
MGVAYAVIGKLGLMFDAASGFATLIWPPTGIALACMLRFGYRLWPGVLLGAFVVNVWSGAPVLVATGIALGNSLEGVLGAYALRRVGFHDSLDRLRDVVALVALAALASSIVSATVGVTSLYLGARVTADTFAATWRFWWIGDAISDLVVAPLFLILLTKSRERPRPARVLEAVALGLATLITSGVVFGTRWIQWPTPSGHPYVLYPVLIWGAVRFGSRGGTLTMVAASIVAVVATALGSGPFVRAALGESLLHLSVFVATIAVTILTLGAVVAERASAQHEARNAVARNGAILDAAIDGVVTIDDAGSILEFNPAAEAVFGYRRHEVLGRSLSDLLIPPQLGAHDGQSFARTLATGQGPSIGKSVEVSAIHKSGAQVPIELTVVRVPIEGPAVFTSFIRDLSERHRAEAERRRSYSLLQAVIEGTTDAVYVKDIEGRYLLINSAGARVAGSTVEATLGKDDSALFPAEWSRAIIERDRHIMTTGETVTVEETVSVGGRERIFWSMKGPYLDHAGAVRGLIGISRDISDRKQLERDLRDALNARDEFLSIASHELRTPLTTLALQLDSLRLLLQRDLTNDGKTKVSRKVDVAVRQADRLTILVDGLLNVSRASREIVLEPSEFDLASVVRDLTEGFADEAARAGCELVVSGASSAVGRWDRTRLEQAISNLVANALKYGPGAPIDIVLTTEADSVTIAIRDRGIGIADADLVRIFGRFERAVPSTHYGGLGLGLYITRQILEAHGGTIEAASQPGEGATFTIRLPRWPAATSLGVATEVHT